jgi:hypothetical protein
MSLRKPLSTLVVCAIFAAGWPSWVHAASASAGGAQAVASVAATVPEKQLSDYPGLKSLVAKHCEVQREMVKLWRTLKEGKGDDKVAADYKAAQERVAKASEKVSEFISRDKWSDADRAEMQRLWAAELEKSVE